MPGIASKLITQPVFVPSPVETVPDICFCAPLQCQYREKAFALVGSDNDLYNDKSTFLFRKAVPSDTVAVSLWRRGQLVANVTASNAAFTLYPFPQKPEYFGVLVNWKGVQSLHGYGIGYQIRAIVTVLGQSSDFESRIFDLLPYSPTAANNTFRMETWQNGEILRGSVDYRGLLPDGWYSSYRLPGLFSGRSPELTTDNYLDSQYRVAQIQDRVRNSYTIETEFLPEGLSKELTDTNILADRIRLTGYSVFEPDQYAPVDVYVDSIERRQVYGIKKHSYTVKVYERNENVIKRRF